MTYLRLTICGLIALAAGAATPAYADVPTTPSFEVAAADGYLLVASELEQSGYRIVSITRTMLGRIRITARSGRHEREVIVSRSTGEVLRDMITKEIGAPRRGVATKARAAAAFGTGTAGGAAPDRASGGGADRGGDAGGDSGGDRGGSSDRGR